MARLQAGIEPIAPNELTRAANPHRAISVPMPKIIAKRYARVPANFTKQKRPPKGALFVWWRRRGSNQSRPMSSPEQQTPTARLVCQCQTPSQGVTWESLPTRPNKKGPQRGPSCLVEAAGIEPASASPPLRGLHAYSVFNLIAGYPTGRENLKPAQ